MKRARGLQVEDEAESIHERASSRRRTFGSTALEDVQPVAGDNEQSLTSQNAETEAGDEGDDQELSVKSVAGATSSLQDSDDAPAIVDSFASNPWGFVVYRTFYGDETEWQLFRRRLGEITDSQRDSIESEGADPQSVTLDFIEDEATLNSATSRQIRL